MEASERGGVFSCEPNSSLKRKVLKTVKGELLVYLTPGVILATVTKTVQLCGTERPTDECDVIQSPAINPTFISNCFLSEMPEPFNGGRVAVQQTVWDNSVTIWKEGREGGRKRNLELKLTPYTKLTQNG